MLDEAGVICGTALAVLAGLAFIAVPTMLSQVLWPGWILASADESDAGFVGWLTLIGLSGLCLVAAGVWFGVSAKGELGLQIFVRMYVGAVIGTYASVGAMAPYANDVGLAAGIFAIGIGIPFWFFAGLGLTMGSVALRLRRQRA